MKKIIKSDKGSLSVEAAISFPVFIGFLMLLMFCVKIASIHIVLNHAVNETAKQLATSAYPMALINNFEDDVFSDGLEGGIPTLSEEAGRIKGYISEGADSILEKLFSGDLEEGDIDNGLEEIKKNVISDYTTGVAQHLANSLGEDYYKVKARVRYEVAAALLGNLLKDGVVDKEKIELLLVELPQSSTEYQYRTENELNTQYTDVYEAIGFTPEKDDVVMVVRYKTKIPIPFFKDKELVYLFTAVEKAWIQGSNGIYTVYPKSEGTGDDTNASEQNGRETSVEENYEKLNEATVYVTPHGERYHKGRCFPLTTRQIRPIKIGDAQAKGLTPCKICYGN